MEIDELLKTIQDSCNAFIKQNLEKILTQFEKNKTLLDKNFSDIKINHIDKKSWSVYVFYINPQKTISSYDDLNNLWQTNFEDKLIQSPRVIKGKFKTLTSGQSACFYVGKSEDLKSRISQHIHQRTMPSTYGLKISEHNRLHMDNTFEYSFFVLKVNPSKQITDGMKCLLVTLERHLRENLKPLIGKQ